MRKALQFVRLDFITIRPYLTLKNLAIIIVVPLFIFFSSGGSSAAFVFSVFSVMYVGYPFAIGERCNMDALYPTLSLSRATVVWGRYLFVLAFNLCAALWALACEVLSAMVSQRPINGIVMLLSTLVSFALICFVEAIQLPIYFKLGYSKSKMMTYLPLFVLWIAVLGLGRISSAGGPAAAWLDSVLNWIETNALLALFLAGVLWLGAILLSLQTSLAWYKKREF